jgi:ApbE superfamily uncharacterized protein (UPF0280 family)
MKTYRERLSCWPCYARLLYRKTDILIASESPIDPEMGKRVLVRLWNELTGYLRKDPLFGMSLEPVRPRHYAPEIAFEMAEAARQAGVGPMAAVAGAFAEGVARVYPGEICVENGGDAFIRSRRERHIEVLSCNPRIPSVRIALPSGSWGIATSSGKIGPSLSLGNAWAATVVARSGALADAWATRLGNEAGPGASPEKALSVIRGADGVLGGMVISDESLALWGLRLV